MSRYLNPQLTVAQAGPMLEKEFRQRFGNEAFDKLYRTLTLLAEEQTTTEETQVLGMLAMVGKTQDQINLFLSIIWLARKEARDPLIREMSRNPESCPRSVICYFHKRSSLVVLLIGMYVPTKKHALLSIS